MRRAGLIIFLSIITQIAFAQSDEARPSLADKSLELDYLPDSLLLDSLSVVPGSISIQAGDNVLDTTAYRYDPASGFLFFTEKVRDTQPVLIRYRSLPFAFGHVYAHKSMSLYDSTAFFREKATLEPKFGTGSGEELFATPKLAKSGSISRGISIGNRSSVFVNASLNLQMEGELTDDLRIRASITDQNIPVQPEGNAQHISDFDNVLVELYNKHFSLMSGDVVFQQSGTVWQGNSRAGNELNASTDGSYFLRYRRNVQGAQLKLTNSFWENMPSATRAGFALAKGKFASLALEIQEGVQGPYRLQAPENQALGGGNGRQLGAFFIIANSEKVYLDGKLLQRGIDRDYIIDYNLGEITFSSNVLLTRFSRVYVDFEYADRNYSRSVFTISHQQHFEKVRVYADYFREGDNPNQGLDFNLSDNEKSMLREAGDAGHQLFVSSVDSVKQAVPQPTFQPDRNADVPGVGNLYQVTYNRRDTLVAGETYQIYTFAGQEGDFSIDFHYVGEGQGDYLVSGSAVNSKVFEWVAPVNNQPRGNYAPRRPIVTPKLQQMLVLGAEAKLTALDRFSTEIALSDRDLNVLSPLDAEDDRGHAFTMKYRGGERQLLNTAWRWSNHTAYEFRQADFTEVDPYRSIEFERDWFIRPYRTGDSSRSANDHILSSTLQLKQDQNNRFRYEWMGRKRSGQFAGQQHRMHWQKSLGLLRMRGDAFLLRNVMDIQRADWNRLNADFSLNTKYIQPGYHFQMDKNRQSLRESDSVTFTSMNFEQHRFYLQSGDSLKGTFRLDYSLRKDFLPTAGQLRASDLAQTLQATADLNMLRNHHFKLQLAYRELTLLNDSLFTNRTDELEDMQRNTLLGQLHWRSSLAGGAIRSQLHYSLGNGREPRREFVYVKVPVGEGLYTWRDDNGNGIEELDEFYEARYFDEKNYVRVFVPGNEFILAYTNNFSYQLKLLPPKAWLDKTGIRSVIGRFSSVTSWDIQKRITATHLAERTIPMLSVNEADLLSMRENLRSTLFFNRSNTNFAADLGMRRLHRKQLLNRGYEERIKAAYLLNLRWNLNRQWGVRWKGERGREHQVLDISSGNDDRNFSINYFALAPELTWQPNMHTRLATHYRFINRQNLAGITEEGKQEAALQQVLGLELRMNKMMKHNVQANLEYVVIDYNGEENSAIAYEMLEGLGNGSNLRWSVNWQQNLLDGLQLTLNYFGRKSEQSSTIHSGSVMIRALF